MVRDWSSSAQRNVRLAFWGLFGFNILLIIALNLFRTALPEGLMRTAGVFVTIQYIPKLFWVVFLLIDDALRLFRWLFSLVTREAVPDSTTVKKEGISRLDFLVKSGFGLALGSLMAGTYGIAKGAHHYQIKRINLP